MTAAQSLLLDTACEVLGVKSMGFPFTDSRDNHGLSITVEDKLYRFRTRADFRHWPTFCRAAKVVAEPKEWRELSIQLLENCQRF